LRRRNRGAAEDAANQQNDHETPSSLLVEHSLNLRRCTGSARTVVDYNSLSRCRFDMDIDLSVGRFPRDLSR
jgi:hypothetical protein